MYTSHSGVRHRINLLGSGRPSSLSSLKLVGIGLAFLVGVYLLLAASTVWAADLTPMATVESGSVTGVSSAELLKPGQFAAGLSLFSASAPVGRQVIEPESTDNEAVTERMSRVQASLGYGVARFLELDLGISGSQEVLAEEHRQFFAEENHAESGFAGASVLAKFRLFDSKSLKLGLAPFIETGAGTQAEQSFSRSKKAKGGWMVMTTYAAPRIVQLDANAGYRYREREQIGAVSLRNELFYQASIEAMFSQFASLYVGGRGRQLKVADENEVESGEKRRYETIESNEVFGGLVVKMRRMRVSAFGGTRTGDAMLGSEATFFGLKLGYVFGSSQSAPSSVMVTEEDKAAAQDQADEAALEDVPEPTAGSSKKMKPLPDYSKYKLTEDKDLEKIKDDDYDRIISKIKEEKAAEKEPAQIDKIEEELRNLEAAEEKQKAEQTKADERRLREESRRLNNEIEEFDEEREEVREEMEEEGEEAFPEIEEDDVHWNGLYE